MKKTLILLFALFSLIACNKKAATTTAKVDNSAITQGTITYEIDDVTGNPAAAAIKGSTIQLFMNNENNRMTMEVMQGLMRMSTYTNLKTTDTQMFMSMMGQKIKVVIPDSMKTEAKKKALDQNKKQEFTYDKNDKKDILGYACYKANMKAAEGNAPSIGAYVTDKINIKMNENITNQAGGLLPNGLTGFPLQLIISANGMKMTMTAKEFLKTVQAEDFVQPTGYKEMSFDEFMKMMGGMKMGF